MIDLEDLSSGVSIADLTLNDFRTDLSGFLRDNKERMEAMPLGTYAVAPALRSTVVIQVQDGAQLKYRVHSHGQSVCENRITTGYRSGPLAR